MKRFAGLVASILLLTGCAAQSDPATEPTQAEKAWHNCTTVLEASPTPTTDESITPESICENQRATWDDFDSKWLVEIDRLVDFYEVDRSDVSVYAS